MARKESDLVKGDSWNLNGLVSPGHAMHDWCERRVKGILTAELTETVRQHIGDNVLGLTKVKGTFDTDGRKAIKDYLEADANSGAVDSLRAQFRAEAQSAFDSGTYGAGTRGPVAESPRIVAIVNEIVAILTEQGKPIPDALLNDRARRAATADDVLVNPKYRQHRKRFENALAALPSKAVEVDL